ncbi:hypothetical protein [Endozoicomonas arenosclerae]|uniref:hypothetical protein n=1 Tax=Endozoicomonas arenosclerae TaxID=1633495 RepID=UPI000781D1C5|nr:hypothetical protein [Endozoicomonas arenosclerae]
MLDLSFTKDQTWKNEREELWKLIERDLKETFRRNELKDLKHYFFSGESIDTYKNEDSGKLVYFPLQTKEAWDFILKEVIIRSSEFKNLVLQNFRDDSGEPHIAPYELALWDYFLTETFEDKVTSRVPVGSQKVIVTVDLDPFEVFSITHHHINLFLFRGRGRDWPKWLERPDYYWSLWRQISDECFEHNDRDEPDNKASSAYFIEKILSQLVEFKPERDFPDPNQTRPKFLALLAEKMDEMYDDLCPRLQQLWDETKAAKAAKDAGQ